MTSVKKGRIGVVHLQSQFQNQQPVYVHAERLPQTADYAMGRWL